MSRPAQVPKFWVPVLVWMGVIFIASTDLGSTTHTSRIIGPIFRFFKPDVSQIIIDTWQVFFRKCAHLGEYAVLALLLARALEKRTLLPLSMWPARVLALAVLSAMGYAVSDEFHQWFVATRESSFWDVLTDTTGAGGALLVLQTLGFMRRLQGARKASR